MLRRARTDRTSTAGAVAAPAPPLRPRWAAGLAGLAVVVGVATACGPTPSATTADTFGRPANGVFTLSGHGWGHGRGMSQWGAQGAATLGVGADTILATYYPSTAKTVQPDSQLRVLVTADEGRDLQVLPAAGLTVLDGAGRRLALPVGPARWRVLDSAAGLGLQRLDAISGAWTGVPVAGASTLTSPVRFSTSTGLVTIGLPDGTSHDYRGTATAVRRSTGGIWTTVSVSMESYLRGVVPREMSPSWRPAALQAQAVAARTYAAARRAAAPAGAAYDICDSTACQVFPGASVTSTTGVRTSYEYASTDTAVTTTAGHVRTYAGRPAGTEFSASNGGWTVSGGQPYLPARADAWDGAAANPLTSWSATLPAAVVEAKFPSVGSLRTIRVTKRDGNGAWGGRVVSVVLEGTDVAGRPTSVTTTGAGIAGARSWPGASDGLRSNWWTITNGAPAS